MQDYQEKLGAQTLPYVRIGIDMSQPLLVARNTSRCVRGGHTHKNICRCSYDHTLAALIHTRAGVGW